MRELISCIQKYIETSAHEDFVSHWKQLAERLIKGIRAGYDQGSPEPEIVKTVESVIQQVGSFTTSNNDFSIHTRSIFVHGSRSQVKFDFYGQETQRELGDIILILSIVYRGKKFFEKMTINQVKKNAWGRTSWSFNSKSPAEQLYLLSRFPTFTGVKGSIIPMKRYNLPNFSGCLGSHGLLYPPGDFALISSKKLSITLSGLRTFRLGDIFKAMKDICGYFPPYDMYCNDTEEILKIILHLQRFQRFPYYRPFTKMCEYWKPWLCYPRVLGNICVASNAYDFAHVYLLGHVGEPIYTATRTINRQAFEFLHDLLRVIRHKGKREYDDFVKSFAVFPYASVDPPDRGRQEIEFDPEGGGLGIVHTLINLSPWEG